jgi:hypothetical protein
VSRLRIAGDSADSRKPNCSASVKLRSKWGYTGSGSLKEFCFEFGLEEPEPSRARCSGDYRYLYIAGWLIPLSQYMCLQLILKGLYAYQLASHFSPMPYLATLKERSPERLLFAVQPEPRLSGVSLQPPHLRWQKQLLSRFGGHVYVSTKGEWQVHTSNLTVVNRQSCH